MSNTMLRELSDAELDAVAAGALVNAVVIAPVDVDVRDVNVAVAVQALTSESIQEIDQQA